MSVFALFGMFLRFGATQITMSQSLPIGTFAVNFIGSALAGSIYVLAEQGGWISPSLRVALSIGLLGCMTTFSSLSLETILMFERGQFWLGSLYVLSTNICGLLGCFAAVRITRIFVI